MRAEDKLEEAKDFLDMLKEISRTISADSQWEEGREVHIIEPKFKHIFSACIQALRSVFDVLLYDYAEKYKLIVGRQDYMNKNKFFTKAKACGSSKSRKFIKWYREKFEELMKEHLFFVRKATAHRGGIWMDTKLKNTYSLTKEGIKIEKEIHIGGMPETVAVSECEKIYLQMENIVKEAREKFR
jgi:hypothetical protein